MPYEQKLSSTGLLEHKYAAKTTGKMHCFTNNVFSVIFIFLTPIITHFIIQYLID